MAISYVGSATGSLSGTTVPFTKPVGVVEDDLLIVVLTQMGGYGAVSLPSGWVLLRTDSVGGLSGVISAIYWKIVGPAEPVGYSFGGMSTDSFGHGTLLAYRGADTADPFDGDGATGATSGTSVVAPSITTTKPGGWLIFAASGRGAGDPVSPPVGMTERSDFGVSDFFGQRVHQETADQALVAAGATGTRTATSSLSQHSIGQLVALLNANEAPNAPTPTYPVGGLTIDRTVTNRFTVPFSDPDPGDSQSALELRYRVDGSGAAWTTVTSASPNQYIDVVGGTFTADDFEWQARLTDAAGEVGLWSSSVFFTAVTPSAGPTITDPVNGATLTSSAKTVTFSYPSLTAFQWRVVGDNAGVADTGDIISAGATVSNPAARAFTVVGLPDATTVHIQVRVEDGVYSAWADSINPVDFTEPATPTVVVMVNTAGGRLDVAITNPAPSGGQPAVAYNGVYRRVVGDDGDGIRVVADQATNSTFQDRAVASGVDYEYRAQAVGVNGTFVWSDWEGDDTAPPDPDDDYYGGY